MRLVFPNSHRINRGNYVVKELAEACRANDVTDLIVLHEHRGIPGSYPHSHSNPNHPFTHSLTPQTQWSSPTFPMALQSTLPWTTSPSATTLTLTSHPPSLNNTHTLYLRILAQSWGKGWGMYWSIFFRYRRRTVRGWWPSLMKMISSRSGEWIAMHTRLFNWPLCYVQTSCIR